MTLMQIIINTCCSSPFWGIASADPATASGLLLEFLRSLKLRDCLPRFFTVNAASGIRSLIACAARCPAAAT